MVLLCDDRKFHGSLGRVVFYRNGSRFEILREAWPTLGHVFDRFTERVFGTQRCQLLVHPRLELCQNWTRLFFAQCEASFDREFASFVFDVEQQLKVAQRLGGLRRRAQVMNFFELSTRVRMAARPSELLGPF